jgi:hypothetical protein
MHLVVTVGRKSQQSEVLQSRFLCICLASGLDIIYNAPGHAFTGRWIMLHNPKDLNSGTTGEISMSVWQGMAMNSLKYC